MATVLTVAGTSNLRSDGLALAIPGRGWTEQHVTDSRFPKPLVGGTPQHAAAPRILMKVIHTIFEGTSEIQQLVISRAISGLRIE